MGFSTNSRQPVARACVQVREIPHGCVRIGRVEDIAACAVYLASPAASWVTGKVFEVDGGSEIPAFRFPTTPL